MSATGLIYALVSRGHETILSSFSAYAGNFPSVALDVHHCIYLGSPSMQFVKNIWSVCHSQFQFLHFRQGGIRIFGYGRLHCNYSFILV
jgi:hypothetical protein